MKKNSAIGVLAVLCCVVAMSCGSTDKASDEASGPPKTWTGVVRDTSGDPAGGIVVWVEERTTGAQARVVTANDGTFTAEGDDGVYDVVVDDESRTDDPASMVGPVVVTGGKAPDLVLRAATATEPGTVSGTLLLPSGEPLANRKLRVLPITARSYDPSQPATVPGPIEVTTGPDGSFTVNLGTGQEVGFNLEVYGPDGTTLVEFVDVEKPSGPFSVTLTTGGDVKNRLGVSDEPPPEPVKGRSPIGASRHGKTRPFTARITTSDLNIFRTDARLENGLIVPELGVSNTKCREWDSLLTNSGVIARNESLNQYFFRYEKGMVGGVRYGKVCLSDLSYNDPFYDYQIEISTDSPATWRFFDVLAASYALRVYRAGDHWLNYNSKEPEINTIEISTGLV